MVHWHCNSSSKGFDSRYGGRDGGADPGNTWMWWSIVRRGGRVDGRSSGKTSWNSSSKTCKSLLSQSVVSVVVSIIPSAEFPAVTQARNPLSPCRRAWRACWKFNCMSKSSPGDSWSKVRRAVQGGRDPIPTLFVWKFISGLFFASKGLPKMTSYLAKAKTVNDCFSLSSATVTVRGTVHIRVSDVILPSARVTEKSPSDLSSFPLHVYARSPQRWSHGLTPNLEERLPSVHQPSLLTGEVLPDELKGWRCWSRSHC